MTDDDRAVFVGGRTGGLPMKGVTPSEVNSVVVGCDMRTRSTRSPTRSVEVKEL